MKYAIIGTGAIGGYFGGKLAQSGKEVHFLFHSDYNYVKEHGLKINSVKGDFELNPINAYALTTDMPKVDVVLVCLKTTQNAILPELLRPILHEETIIILIQNGVGVEEDLQNLLPNAKIAGGLAFIGVRKVKPGFIEHLDEGALTIGAFSDISKLKLMEIMDDFEEAGVDCAIEDLVKARWKKLLWNISFNGLSVILNASTKDMLVCASTRKLLNDVMHEVIVAAQHLGVSLSPSLPDKIIANTDKMVPYFPSMKLDYDYKRPMEIFYIYTKPIAMALLAGVEMPKASVLEAQLKYFQSQYLK